MEATQEQEKKVDDNIEIKVVTDADELDQLRTLLFCDYLEAGYSKIGVNWNYLHMRAYHLYMMQTDGAFCVLATDKTTGLPVGAIYSVFTPSHACDPLNNWCMEGGWYVHPLYRGKGLGWKLIEAAEKEASRKATVFTTGVVYRNGVAPESQIEAMKARGYVPVAIKFVKPLVPIGG